MISSPEQSDYRLRVCVLASGSSGNCTYVGTAQTGILIDAGISGRETERRLDQIGVSPDDLQGICVTHEHHDHIAAIHVLHKRHGIPVFANSGTLDGLRGNVKCRDLPWQVFTTGTAFTIGNLSIEPFSVPHDAYDPVGFIITRNDEAMDSQAPHRVGVVTDMGLATNLIRERLRPCDVLVLESNHDEALLQTANRPWSLKQRIRGRQGHLSNDQAAEIAIEAAGERLTHIFLAHLSRDCNAEYLAVETMRKKFERGGHTHIRVSCTYPDRISDIAIIKS